MFAARCEHLKWDFPPYWKPPRLNNDRVTFTERCASSRYGLVCRVFRSLGFDRGLCPAIREVDINPFLAGPEKLIALDARIVIWDKDTQEANLPRLAIRPYPLQYVTQCFLDDGSLVTIRPIRPEDEPLMVEFHRTPSERSVYMRYFAWRKLDQRTAHERLARMCFLDYGRQVALVGERIGEHGRREIVAVGSRRSCPT